MAGYGQPRTRVETLAEHAAALQELRQELQSNRTKMHVPNIAARKAAPPYSAPPPPAESCRRILINDLDLGVVHRSRILRGRLITDAYIKMQSVQSVLEDDAGDVVMVSCSAS